MARPFVPGANAPTWDTIKGSMDKFTPSIALEEYVDFEAPKAIDVHDHPSVGVDFVLAKSRREELLDWLRHAETAGSKKAFEEGRWEGALHAAKGAAFDLANSAIGRTNKDSWALNISFKSTKGVGFRQIWYLELTDRPPPLQNVRPFPVDAPRPDPRFNALFEDSNQIDQSALHWAIGDPDEKSGNSGCNVHIDQVGITANIAGKAAVTPDFLYHTLVELVFRTGLKGHLSSKKLQAMDFIMPSSHQNYALNFGAQISLINRKDLKLSIRGLCSVHDGGCEWTRTINLKGTHDIWGSK